MATAGARGPLTGQPCLVASPGASLHRSGAPAILQAIRRISRDRRDHRICSAAAGAAAAAAANSASRLHTLAARAACSRRSRSSSQRPPSKRQHHHAVAAAAAAAEGSSDAPAQGPTLLQRLGAFLGSNFIPCGLVLAILIGWFFPGPGVAAAAADAGTYATIGIFVISGLLLQKGESLAAVRSTAAVAYGLTAILALTPLLSFALLRAPLRPREMALGLAVFACMPTTLSANVTLTTAAGGNTAVALLLTVASNTLAVFTIPPMLSLVLGSGAAGVAAFDAAQLFRNLLKTVLLPLLLGAALQGIIPGAQHWKRDHRKLLSYASACCLCTVPWMQVSKAAAARLPLTPAALLAAAATALCAHLALLGANLAVTRFVRFAADPAQQLAIRKAVVLAASMKTLPVAVAVLGQLGGQLGAGVGFAVIPCILAHLLQTVFDSAVVSCWNRREAAGLPPLD